MPLSLATILKCKMKRIISSLYLIISISSYAQWAYKIDFEDPDQLYKLEIDTISHANNIWQVGRPQKNLFTSAYSFPNAIVTDIINVYPPNDTSSFIFKHIARDGFTMPHTVILSGKYRVNSDTLKDYGTIEFSPDNGGTWINLITDTFYSNRGFYYWESTKPTLSGNSSDWEDFNIWLAGLGPVFNIRDGDTVLYRFTFISDSIQNYKDGLMFDDFYFQDWSEGINEFQNQFLSKAYPNPASGLITIEFENEDNSTHLITIYNCMGQSIIENKSTEEDFMEIDLSNYNSGIYFFKLAKIRNWEMSSGKIIIQ
jgi:hypothetical protein